MILSIELDDAEIIWNNFIHKVIMSNASDDAVDNVEFQDIQLSEPAADTRQETIVKEEYQIFDNITYYRSLWRRKQTTAGQKPDR